MNDTSDSKGKLSSLFQGKYFESYERLIGTTLNGISFRDIENDEIYGSDFSLWGLKDGHVANLVFSAAKLRIKHYRSLSFKNCIFCGEVSTGDDESVYTEIDDCYVPGSLGIILHHGEKNEIKVISSNCNKIRLYNNRFSEITLLYNRINKLEITDNKGLVSLSVFANEIQQFIYSNNSAAEIFFPSSQIDPRKLLVPKEKIETQFLPYWADSTWGEREPDFYLSHTIDFLLEKTNLKFDNPRKAEFHLIKARNSLKPGPAKGILTIFGYFFKPFNVLLCMFAMVIIFSTIYFFNFELLQTEHCTLYQRIINSLYFSGITFLTIGYGDIVPLGWLKVVAIIEGFSGVFFSGSFLASLIRKYTET